MFEAYVSNNPRIKALLNELLKDDSPEVKSVIQPIIHQRLEEARMTGINIGWQSAMLRLEETVGEMSDIEQVKDYVKNEAKKVRERLKIKEQGEDE